MHRKSGKRRQMSSSTKVKRMNSKDFSYCNMKLNKHTVITHHSGRKHSLARAKESLCCMKIVLRIALISIMFLQIVNCQNNFLLRNPSSNPLEEDFHKFQDAQQHQILPNKRHVINGKIRKYIQPPSHAATVVQKRLGQLNQRQKVTGTFNGDTQRHMLQSRQKTEQRKNKIPLPQNKKPIRTTRNRKVALRQNQRERMDTSASNRHEIIRNWESYKVKRQHHLPNMKNHEDIKAVLVESNLTDEIKNDHHFNNFDRFKEEHIQVQSG